MINVVRSREPNFMLRLSLNASQEVMAICTRQRIKYMDTWKDIRRGICFINKFYKIHKYIIPSKFIRPQMLHIGINIGDNEKNGHSHHQVKNQLVVFLLVFIHKYKIKNSKSHVRKPQQIRNDKKFTEGNHIIKKPYGLHGNDIPDDFQDIRTKSI